MRIDEVVIDNQNGWGETPNNRNIDYLGLRVKMQPSVFLKLAAPLREYTSKEDIKNHIEQGGSIGAPMLYITIPDEWLDRDYIKPAKVTQHEGRNRCKAVLELEGDEPIETHLILDSYYQEIRNRHIKPEWLKQLNRVMIPEKSESIIRGPFFYA